MTTKVNTVAFANESPLGRAAQPPPPVGTSAGRHRPRPARAGRRGAGLPGHVCAMRARPRAAAMLSGPGPLASRCSTQPTSGHLRLLLRPSLFMAGGCGAAGGGARGAMGAGVPGGRGCGVHDARRPARSRWFDGRRPRTTFYFLTTGLEHRQNKETKRERGREERVKRRSI